MAAGRGDLLKQLQPLRRNAVFELGEAGDVASRPRQTFDDAQANWVDRLRKYNRNAAARFEERHDRHAGRGQHDVRLKRYQLHRIGAETFGIAVAPSEIDLQISADRPTQLLQALNKRRSATVHLGVIGTGIREHADAPHALAAPHVWMAPAWQEEMQRAAQKSLAVMCPACSCSPDGLLALMESANRGLIIRAGSMSQ